VRDDVQELTDQQTDTAEAIVSGVLSEVLGHVEFVLVKARYAGDKWDDDYGDYLKINAIYRGKCEDLGKKTLEVPHLLIPRLEQAGFTAYPIIYYISKSDWDQYPE